MPEEGLTRSRTFDFDGNSLGGKALTIERVCCSNVALVLKEHEFDRGNSATIAVSPDLDSRQDSARMDWTIAPVLESIAVHAESSADFYRLRTWP